LGWFKRSMNVDIPLLRVPGTNDRYKILDSDNARSLELPTK